MTALHEVIAIAVPNVYSAERVQSVFPCEISDGRLLIQVVGPNDIRKSYQALKDAHVGVFLARGGTYRDFSQLGGEIPLLEMRLSMLDILDTLRNAEETGGYQRFYLLLNESIGYDETLCRRFINTSVVYCPFHSIDDLNRQINELPDDGLVVGSGFVSELSKSRDLPFLNISLKPDMLRFYYEQAQDVARQLRREKEYLAQLRATLTQIEEGIIVLDESGYIQNANQRGALLLGAENQALDGMPILDLLPEFPFFDLLGREVTEPKYNLVQVGGISLNLSIVSYVAYHSERYYLLTVQTVQDIQKREHDIRLKLAHKGLTAQHTFSDIHTQDPAMRRTIRQAEQIADEPGPVLLIGESGTGKELFAQSIHNKSQGKNGPFVAVNCAALNESLLESELFGYVGGAFTGARKDGKAGLFELAHQGTIFLDEINSMPLGLQSKILRVLEERKVMRLGSDYVIPLDVRLISAANQDLLEQVRAGTFRLDLYYRLNTFSVRIPPLRQRKADIELLFRTYVNQYQKTSSSGAMITQEFLQMLQEHDWPGNIRELRNTALRFVAFSGDNSMGEILHNDEPKKSQALTDMQGHIDLRELSHTVEQLVIQSLLDSGMGKADAARILGISRQALYQKMNRPFTRDTE